MSLSFFSNRNLVTEREASIKISFTNVEALRNKLKNYSKIWFKCHF